MAFYRKNHLSPCLQLLSRNAVIAQVISAQIQVESWVLEMRTLYWAFGAWPTSATKSQDVCCFVFLISPFESTNFIHPHICNIRCTTSVTMTYGWIHSHTHMHTAVYVVFLHTPTQFLTHTHSNPFTHSHASQKMYTLESSWLVPTPPLFKKKKKETSAGADLG